MSDPTQARRSVRLWALLCAAILALTLGPTASADPPRTAEPSAAAAQGTDEWVESTLAGMSVREKVGHLFMAEVYGETADTQNPADVARNQGLYGVDNAEQLIDKYQPGGIVYFSRTNNTNNPGQIAGLSNGIQDAALAQPAGAPSLIAIDQEGGIVARVGPPATQFPGNMALGAGGRSQDARTAADITGRELAAMGVNWNFAPVADVNMNSANPVIGVRSFSEDPDLAADMTSAQVRGYQGAGLAAAAKHFPGHGDTNQDSHLDIPTIFHTREEWEQFDQPPFQAAVDGGVRAIMTAHIEVPSLDPAFDPATLSRPILTGILREEMGYEGIIITDALNMEGVRIKYGDDRVPVLALQAGADILLMPPEYDVAYNAVLDAVENGEITEERVDTSVRRILALKQELGLVDDPYVDVDAVDGVVGTKRSLKQAQKITDRTTTLVKNDGDLLPLDPGGTALVTGWGVSTTQTLADKMTERGVATDVLETGINPSDAKIDAAVAAADAHDVTVVLTNRASIATQAQQQVLVQRLVATGKPVVAVAVRDPYDVRHYPDVPAFVATYSYFPVALDSLARVLFGELAPKGTLPVTIPVEDDPDTVLYPFGHGLSY